MRIGILYKNIHASHLQIHKNRFKCTRLSASEPVLFKPLQVSKNPKIESKDLLVSLPNVSVKVNASTMRKIKQKSDLHRKRAK